MNFHNIKIDQFALVVILMVMMAQFCLGTSPLSYFKERSTFSKHLKRNPESRVYLGLANQRIRSMQGDPSEKLSRMTPVDDTFLFDGVMNFDTVNIDLHPYVVDVGCTERKLFIRLDTSAVQFSRQHFLVGKVVVSSKYGFVCTKNELNSAEKLKEDLLYRFIERSELIQLDGISYVELTTKTMKLSQLISNLSFQIHKLPTDRKTTTTSKRWAISGVRLPQISWKFNTATENGPAIEQYSYTQDGIGTISCRDCWVAAGIGFSFDVSSQFFLPDTFVGHITYDFNMNMIVNAKETKHDFPFNYPLFPEGDFYTLQEFLYIPIKFNMRAKLIIDLISSSDVDIDLSFSYRYSGSISFVLFGSADIQTKNDPPPSAPKFGIQYNKIDTNIELKIYTGLYFSIFTVFAADADFTPRFQLNPTNSLRPDCLLGVDFKAGIEGGFLVREWNLWGIVGSAMNFPFDILPFSRIPYLSDICIHQAPSSRSLLNSLESAEIERVQTSACCSVSLNDNAIKTGANITIPDENFEFYDSIILKLEYTKSAVIQYADKTITTSAESVQVALADLTSAGKKNILVTFQKGLTEVVTVSYSYAKNSLVLGQETKVKTGLVIIDIQQTLPELFIIRVTGGMLTKQNGDVVPERIETSKEVFPLIWNFDSDSNGTITVYPFYKANSGITVSHLILKKLRFGLIYNSNTIPALNLDSLKLFTGSESRKYGESLDMTVKVITLNDAKASDIYALTSPETSKDHVFSTKFNFLPKYIVFDLSANVNFNFKYELLELYSKHVNTPVSFTYETLSPFGLAITQDSSWASSGLIVSVGQNTIAYADLSMITETTKFSTPFRTTSKGKAIFGFSKYSMSEWIGKKMYMRVEPRAGTAKRDGKATFSGSLAFDKLKNENITVSIKFSSEGKQYDSVSLNSLTSEHKYYLSIVINDAQYTFNEFGLSSVSNFVKFLNSIKTTNSDSKWNTVVLPLLSFQASTSSAFDFKIVSPQELQIKLPVYPSLESSIFTESVSFTSIDTSAFSPSPGGVTSTSSISVTGDSKLTGGDIGSIIASVVGFSIIVTLFIVIIIMIVCLMKKKGSPAKKDLEMPDNKK